MSSSSTPLDLNIPREATWTVVLQNIGLVYKCVNDICGRFQDRDDLVQEGLLGLFEGARRFDPSIGVAFSTYVYPWIRKRVLAFYQSRPEPTAELKEDSAQDDGALARALEGRSIDKAISDSLKILDPVEKLIVVLRWMGEKKESGDTTPALVTYQSLGERLGLTAARINQIEMKAFQKLRKHLEERRIWQRTGTVSK